MAPSHQPPDVFAGIVELDDVPADRQTERRLAGVIAAGGKADVDVRRLGGALFAQRRRSRAYGGYDGQSVRARDHRSLFAAVARLDNREELGAALALDPSELARAADGEIILRMFDRWGEKGVARCIGAFAFALWDADVRRLVLGRDCLGNRALFYHHGRGGVAFATTLNTILALPGVPREIDELAVAEFMVVNPAETRRTFYRGIERVPSRTLVTVDRSGLRHRHYWEADLAARPPYAREEDYVERARELLDQAVVAATRDTPHVAISTSGGLDSSAIAATAARRGRAERITCFTMVPPPGALVDLDPRRYLDERGKVEALARMHRGLDTRFIAATSMHPFEEDDTRLFVRSSSPVLGAAAIGWYQSLADAVAADGHRVLLFGNYGDFGLTWPGTFSLVTLLRERKWHSLARELRATARESDRSLPRTFASELLLRGCPTGLRRLMHRFRGRNPDSVARYSALNPALIAELDLPRQWRMQGFDPWFGDRGWDPARYRAWRLFDANQLARDARATCDERQGFEARDPHADRRLLEFLLTVPEPLFRRNGVPRSFARRVLADRLPREILDERRRGAQAPTWFRNLDARRQAIADDIERLEASPLARRLLDLPRLKRLMAQWPKDEQVAEKRVEAYRLALARGIHVGRFLRWVEGGNA